MLRVSWHEIVSVAQNKKMRRDQAGTPLPRVYTRISRLWRHNHLPSPALRCDEGANIFCGYVYGSVRKVRCRFRACPRRIVIFTSLINSPMLAEITRHRTGTCALYTHRRPFGKYNLSCFLADFWYTWWSHAHKILWRRTPINRHDGNGCRLNLYVEPCA